jgi:hypothetical protein
MKLKVVCAVAVAAVAQGCAKSPETIEASYISDVGYRNWSCDQLVGEEQRLGAALASASQKQRDARSNDTVGVIFLGLPVASLSGDNVAPDIARLKGESKAVSSAMQAKRCSPGAASAAKPGA